MSQYHRPLKDWVVVVEKDPQPDGGATYRWHFDQLATMGAATQLAQQQARLHPDFHVRIYQAGVLNTGVQVHIPH